MHWKACVGRLLFISGISNGWWIVVNRCNRLWPIDIGSISLSAWHEIWVTNKNQDRKCMVWKKLHLHNHWTGKVWSSFLVFLLWREHKIFQIRLYCRYWSEKSYLFLRHSKLRRLDLLGLSNDYTGVIFSRSDAILYMLPIILILD